MPNFVLENYQMKFRLIIISLAVSLISTHLFAEIKPIKSGNLPNVVIIYADDMGYGDLAKNNPDSKVPTPAMDKLANSGMNFTDVSTSSGICSPSRYALLTGEYHWRRFHRIVRCWEDTVFKEDDTTLPKMFKSKGYLTACIGKWHLGWGWKDYLKDGVKPTYTKNGEEIFKVEDFNWTLDSQIKRGPLFAGFDYYFGDDAPNFPPYTWIENDRFLSLPTETSIFDYDFKEGGVNENRPGPMAKGWKQEAVLPTLQKRSIAWIKANKDKPFFLYLPLTSPHTPIVPTAEFRGKSNAGAYGDFLMQTDAFVGEIMKALEENGLLENTIVVFSSDNGAAHYAYERELKFGHVSNSPFRGAKADIWEGAHRVPFIVSWKGKIEAGKTSNQMLSQIDLFKTLAEIIDYKTPENAAKDSKSFLTILNGNEMPVRNTIVLNVEAERYGYRKDNWVYLNHRKFDMLRGPKEPKALLEKRNAPDPKEDKALGQLYDLNVDIGQRANLYDANPELVEKMNKEMRAEMR